MYDNSCKPEDELAEMTDRLLVGQNTEVSAENQDHARIVKQILHMLSSDPCPDALYRARLTRCLNEEWDRLHSQRLRSLRSRLAVRFAALAVSLIVVIGAVLALLNSEAAGKAVSDAALDSLSWVFTVILVATLIVLGLALWSGRH